MERGRSALPCGMDSPRRRRELVDHYVKTGESDVLCSEWPGEHDLTRMEAAAFERRTALIRAVKDLARRGTIPTTDVDVLVRRSHEGISPISTWVPSMLPSSRPAPAILGLSEGTMSYVTPLDLVSEDRITDVIVHESAHVFHNCKRRDAGLKMTKRREWLLDIEIAKRETFAYSCEAYSRILEQSETKADGVRLASEYEEDVDVPDERVENEEVAAIVTEAAEARNGWRVILRRCR